MLKLKTSFIALATVAAVLGGAAQATTITFDEFAATNDGAPVTTLYSGAGITFAGGNAGTWGGNSNGDPGNWSVDGTNGPQFLGFNGPYVDTLTFSSSITSFRADFSRTQGSSDGAISLVAYSGATMVASAGGALGALDSWTTFSLSGLGIDRIELSGTGDAFHPFAMDNVVFDSQRAVPEPATWALTIMGFGMLGAAMRRQKVAVRFA